MPDMPMQANIPINQTFSNTTDFSSTISTKTKPQPARSEETKSNTCLVLQYCRVALLSHDPLQLAVEPCRFEKQIEYLANNFNVISVNEMKYHLERKTAFREKTVVLTFDVGYADVLYTAKEVLERYEVPAAVFATSANITTETQIWPNVLENYLIANRFQGRLDIEIDDELYRWPLTSQDDRFRAYDDLYSILSDKNPSEQKEIIGQINQSLELRANELDNNRTMNAHELKTLEEGELITIGGHTHNYVKLSSLPKWQQIEEVSKNKDVLEEALGHRIEYFSYPFGNDNDHNADTVNVLKDIGFSLACGSCYGTVNLAEETHYYDLPRIKVGNWNQFTFYKFLKGFFG
jgi:peptidoglycan/xylan/chitin deacetylase (PgdA/CDA1 family)